MKLSMPRICICAALCLLAGGGLQAAGPVRFNRDIRPIMSDTCFRCHGPDVKSRMAGLRLDIRQDALKPTKSGITPIVPGAPEKSAIIDRIFAANPVRIMPPKHAHKDLTEPQKDTIRRWVAEGAVYEGHWAYEPVKRPAPPSVGGALVRNPIDAFVQDRLRQENLTPSPEADRRTLMRRVALDLTGIPPTPEEVQAFLADKSPDAYEKQVDRLLASPRYAEMQTMRWLDAVRYGDTAGFHGDNPWPAWPYRDYVLRSFRDNKPFDQFTREQFAGDLLPNPTRDQLVASAFNRLNRVSAEGGLQPKEYLAKYGADRVRTTSTVWLGATVGCAECHDHKFDPYLAKDFYAMKAFFSDIKETGLVPDRGEKAWGAKLMLPEPEQKARMEDLDARIMAAREELSLKAKALRERRWVWEERIAAQHGKGELAWRYQRPLTAEAVNGAKLTVFNDEPIDASFYLFGSVYTEKDKKANGLIVASGSDPDNETYVVTFKPGVGTWTSMGLEVHQDEGLPGNRVARGADRFTLTEVEAEVSEGGSAARKLEFVLANSAGFGEPVGQPAMATIDGRPETGWGVAYGEARNPFLALRLKEKLTTSPEAVVTVRLRHDSAFRRATIGRFRLALSAAEFSAPDTGDSAAKFRLPGKDESVLTLSISAERGLTDSVRRILEVPEAERSEEQNQEMDEFFLWSQRDTEPQIVALAKLQAERSLLEAAIPSVITTERVRPRVTRILPRGNFLDESGAEVRPAIPEVFGSVKTEGNDATRLDLANWLVSPENPLTPRVFVNRTWRQFFGTGFSKILEDLGSQGEWPTHPELVDWLAAEFLQPQSEKAHAWDVNHVVRTIVTSHTYRQSSVSSAALDEKDPDNRLLARQSRFRVDAEVVHDIALSVAGLLKERFGGPSVRPHQPEEFYAMLNFPKREYSASRGDDLYRRALYTHWQRTFLHPSLQAFDAPSREECTVNRASSNTPLQALVLLNDPIYVEAARAFAREIGAADSKLEGRIDYAFRKALNRAPDKQERKIATDLYRRTHTRYGKSDEGESAALVTLARTVLNLHETITRN